jgi:hypothetical protein
MTSDGRDSEKRNRLERHRSSVPPENYLWSDFVALSPKIFDFVIFSLQNQKFYSDEAIVSL